MTLNVTAIDNSGIKVYNYYLNNILKISTDLNEYDFMELESGTTYMLKVEVENYAGNTNEKTINITTLKSIRDLKAGDKVFYLDELGTKRKCTVLYDNEYNNKHGTNYGIQIITDDVVKTVSLGNSNNFNEAIKSYNNAISILNTEAEKYINTIYVNVARSVGSVPDNKNSEATGYFSRSESWFQKYNNTIKNLDTNYKTDLNQTKSLDIHKLSNSYLLASRLISSDASCTSPQIRAIGIDGNLGWTTLANIYYNTVIPYNREINFRPVFLLKSDIEIIDGNGKDIPYSFR